MDEAVPDGGLGEGAEVGAVDSRGVRLWVRQPGAAIARARLDVAGQQPAFGETALSTEQDWTGVILLRLATPAPGRAFVCTTGGRQLRGRLAPQRGTHAGVIFGVGSCNQPFRLDSGRVVLNEATAIYPAIERELRRVGADFTLLIGDQIYSDDVPSLNVRERLPGDAQHPPPLTVALAAYRRVTRAYLGHSGFRALREAFPSYCIWDDHEIFDNWGSRLEKTPLDRLLFQAAAQTFCEYQHARNPGGESGPPPYHYTVHHGDIGILTLDVRGTRDWENGRMLGAEQWEAVGRALAGDELADVQTLFVVSSVPVAHASRWMAKIFDGLPGHNADAVRDRWCSARFVDGRDALLEALFEWEAAGARRQVILLSGDVHCASAFTIRRRGRAGVIQQLTSSAFTTPLTRFQRLMNRLATRAPNLFEPHLRFRRRFLVLANNYALIRAEPLAGGGHRVRCAIRAWDPRSRRLYTAAHLEYLLATPV